MHIVRDRPEHEVVANGFRTATFVNSLLNLFPVDMYIFASVYIVKKRRQWHPTLEARVENEFLGTGFRATELPADSHQHLANLM